MSERGLSSLVAEGKASKSRNSITVLVLGDEGVGKSSLISTFVSRHFSDGVSGIMTRVRLPPEPHSPCCITTIVDSQGGDAALLSAVTSRSVSSPTNSSNSLSSFARGVSTEKGNTANSSSDAYSPATVAGIEHVDSIILVYDLDRDETFYRLENYWLPLIERCYHGKLPVIVAGNKMDLFRPSSSAGMTDEQALSRSRQQVNSLMQRFKFVLQWIKCSSKNLLHIDEVFRKAQQAVLYPIKPLFDLTTARITADGRRAFTRIFRMYDRDNDGLLSDAELDSFQRQAFPVRLVERDFAGWKKIVSRNSTSPSAVAIKDGKFTVSGFLAIFEVFITQNRLESPWRVLRYFGYDDYLNLHIPSSVTSSPSEDSKAGKKNNNWKVSASARRFLTSTFQQFDTDEDGVLSANDIQAIFSILPEPSLPPWHPVRVPHVFQGCFSMPKAVCSSKASLSSNSSADDSAQLQQPLALSSSTFSASGVTICSGTSLPSVDVSSFNPEFVSSPLSYLDWMGCWHMISAISPPMARAELYRLGHIEENNGRKQKYAAKYNRRSTSAVSPSITNMKKNGMASKEFQILVLGSRGCGKTTLLDALCGGGSLGESATSTIYPETRSAHVKVKRKVPANSGGKKQGDGDEIVVHLIMTEVSEADNETTEKHQKDLSVLLGESSSTKKQRFDLTMFVFDSTILSSFGYVKQLEQALTDDAPRMFVGTKKGSLNNREQHSPNEAGVENTADEFSSTIKEATLHCANLDIEAPFLTSSPASSEQNNYDAISERLGALDHIARNVLEDVGIVQLKSRPHGERKMRDAARRRKMMWIGGLVSVSVAVAVGVGVFWEGVTKSGREDRLGGWLRSFFKSPTEKSLKAK